MTFEYSIIGLTRAAYSRVIMFSSIKSNDLLIMLSTVFVDIFSL